MISKRRFAELQLYAVKILLLAVVTAMYGYVWYRYYCSRIYADPFYGVGNYAIILMFTFFYFMFAKLYGGFNLKAESPWEPAFGLCVSSAITVFVMTVIEYMMVRKYYNLLAPMVVLFALLIVVAIVWSHLSVRLYRKLVPPLRTVLLYDNEEAGLDGEGILNRLPAMFSMEDAFCVSGGTEDAIVFLKEKKPNAVMLCGIHSTERNDIVKYCISNNIQAYVRPNIGDFLINGATQMQLCSLPVMLCQRAFPTMWYLIAKRAMDIFVSLVATILLSPLMIGTAIAIKAYDHGPVFYKQVRLTKGGKQFYVYKFRSMRVDAEKDGVARLAAQNDDRITPIGKFIRATRIDELPQLLCILKGDMALVGPRPERPEIARDYEKEFPEFSLRLQAKAGLTGYAQVYGKYNTTPYNKLQMDLQYIGNMNILTDLKILFATVKVVMTPESTEGVAAGQTTAIKEKTPAGEEKK